MTRAHAEYLTAAGVGWLVAPGAGAAPQEEWSALLQEVALVLGAPEVGRAAERAARDSPPAPAVTVLDDSGDEQPAHAGEGSGASGVGTGALLRTLNSAVRMHAIKQGMSAPGVVGSARAQQEAALATVAGYGQVGAAWEGGRIGGKRAFRSGGPCGGVPGTRSAADADNLRSSADSGAGPDGARVPDWGGGGGYGEPGTGGKRRVGLSGSAVSGWSWSRTAEPRRAGRRGSRRGRDARWMAGTGDGGRSGAAPDDAVPGNGTGFGLGSQQNVPFADSRDAPSGWPVASAHLGPAIPGGALDADDLWLGQLGGAAARDLAPARRVEGPTVCKEADESGNVVADTLGAVAKAARAARPCEQVLVAACASVAAAFVAVLDVAPGAGSSGAHMRAWAGRRCRDDAAFRRVVLADWLQQQFALQALGMQPLDRAVALQRVVTHAAQSDGAGRVAAAGPGCSSGDSGRDAQGYPVRRASTSAGAALGNGGGAAVGPRDYRRLWCRMSRPRGSVPPALAYSVWGRRVAELIRYRRQNGSTEVPILGAEDELATWIESVKAVQHQLSPAQVAQAWALGLIQRMSAVGGSNRARQ